MSEIARNAFNYAEGGRVEFHVDGEASPQTLLIEVKDQGPGIAELESVLQGQYRSATGAGLGIMGAQRLMDACEISSSRESGTNVLMKKTLPKRAPIVTVERNRCSPTNWPASARKARSKKSSSRTANDCACSTNCGGGRMIWSGSTASSKTPTAASSRSMPS